MDELAKHKRAVDQAAYENKGKSDEYETKLKTWATISKRVYDYSQPHHHEHNKVEAQYAVVKREEATDVEEAKKAVAS